MDGWQRAMYWDDTGLAVGDAVAEHPDARQRASSFPARCTSKAPTRRKGAGRRVRSSWSARRGSKPRRLRPRSTRASLPGVVLPARRVRADLSEARARGVRRLPDSRARSRGVQAGADRRGGHRRAARRRSGELRVEAAALRIRARQVADRRHRRRRQSFREAIDARRARRGHRRAMGADASPRSARLRQPVPSVLYSTSMACRLPATERRAHRASSRRRPSACWPPSSIPHDLAEWWQVRPVGHRAAAARARMPSSGASTDYRDEVLGRLGGAFHGTVMEYRAGVRVLRRRRLLAAAGGRADRSDGARGALLAAGRAAHHAASSSGRAAKTTGRAGSATSRWSPPAGSGRSPNLKQYLRTRSAARERPMPSDRTEPDQTDRSSRRSACGTSSR